MGHNLIFPVNNKGGVGKTSVLADLSAALAQRHTVGIIDFDDQASLVGTFTGEDVACKPLDESTLEVRTVQLVPSTHFIFSNPLQRLTLDVQPTRAQMTVFPAGLLYDHPERKDRLEDILRREMADVTFFALDLPPIPHPGMILDYTLLPVIEGLSHNGSPHLFPLIVATPDHNVIDIALRGYEKIVDYLHAKGVPTSHIHPIFVLNKVPLQGEENREMLQYTTFQAGVAEKLATLGILYITDLGGVSRINHINRHFDYNGERFRSVVFPMLEGIHEGHYSLFFGHELQLFQYPHLVDVALDHDFLLSEQLSMTGHDKVYMHSLHQLVNYIAATAQARPRKNYVKRLKVFDRQSVTSNVVEDLRRTLEACYQEDDEQRCIGFVTKPGGGSSEHVWYNLPKSLTVPQMAEVLCRTQRELVPSSDITQAAIREQLDAQDKYSFDREFAIRNRLGASIISVEYHTLDPTKMQVAVLRKNGHDWKACGMTVDTYRRDIDVFLRHMANP